MTMLTYANAGMFYCVDRVLRTAVACRSVLASLTLARACLPRPPDTANEDVVAWSGLSADEVSSIFATSEHQLNSDPHLAALLAQYPPTELVWTLLYSRDSRGQ